MLRGLERMIHSAAREIQATGIGAQRGEVLVPRLIGIATQGALSCGAAPLVAGSLVRRGCQVRLAPVPRCDNPAGDGDATVVLATWQEDGRTGAIAAATAPQDKLAAAHARAAVEEWAAAAGPRTLLAAPSPWCSGAVHALEACRRAAAANTGTGHTVRLLAPVPMPPESAAELAGLGAVEVTSLAGAQPGDVIVIPAHGAATEIKVEAAERRLTVVDATCPLVAGAQDKATRLAERGEHIALISQPGAAATGPIASRAAGRVTVVETPAGVGAIRAADSRQVSYMIQPGMPVEAAGGIVSALRARYPSARDPLPGGTCYAASDRAATVRTIAAGSDLVLLLGNAKSADVRQLSAQAREAGAKIQPVGAIADITPDMLAGVDTVGVVESTSAPAVLGAEIIAALAGLGPLTVARRHVSTEVAGQR
jgi:4-hydroxy-3-methylbut-2-enyl diphosphate reductase